MSKKVSVVTVTYNSEKTLRDTLESLLAQTYSNLEYLIVDGASTDGTVELAESYRDLLEQKGVTLRIVSEPDEGLYHAMNKGVALATGEIIGILNSGDCYEPDTAETVAEAFDKEETDVLFGNVRLVRRDGSSFVKRARLRKFQTSRDWNHPTMFVRGTVYKSHPFLGQGIHDDYGCYLGMVREGYQIRTLDKVLGTFPMGGISNRKSLKLALQRIKDRYRWCYRVNGYSRWYLVECIAIEAVKFVFG